MSVSTPSLIQRITDKYHAHKDQEDAPLINTRGHPIRFDRESPEDVTHPSFSTQLYPVIELALLEIKSGERIQITIPTDYSHEFSGELSWDEVEEVQMAIRGESLPPNVFACLRFETQQSSAEEIDSPVVVDIFHL